MTQRLEVERVLRMTGAPLFGVRIWPADVTRKAKNFPMLLGDSEVDVLGKLAAAVEKYGSLDGLAEAIHEAHRVAEAGKTS